MAGRFPTETWTVSLEDVHSYAASLLRLGRGMVALHSPDSPPEQPLELYDFEGCPYCRKVRETLTELDFDYVCRPCGKGSNNRRFVEENGGKQQQTAVSPPRGSQPRRDDVRVRGHY